jgi:hypothetical protein
MKYKVLIPVADQDCSQAIPYIVVVTASQLEVVVRQLSMQT